MTKSDLIKRLADANPHLFMRDIERIVSTVFDEVTAALVRGDRVELRGFGAFSVRQRSSRVGRNPRTGAEVRVPDKVVPYFKTGKGRLKLRKSTLDGNNLIPYLRDDRKKAKVSNYLLVKIDDPGKLINLFDELLGIKCTVSKLREIYLYANVRIHLDQVENLGRFIEFEAVCSPDNQDEAEQYEKIDYLLQKLRIKYEQLIAGSYEDMI